MDIPVLCLFFNRPDKVSVLLEQLRKIKPLRLYVSCDGPRSESDIISINKVRDLINQLVDWECDLRMQFHEKNLGCRDAVVSGINWFFSKEASGIILEDDCLPNENFFKFCQYCLEKYRDDLDIFHISGTRFNCSDSENEIFISDYALMWGWATWRNRWQHYSMSPSDYLQVIFRKWWSRPIVFFYWVLVCRSVYSGIVDTWDIQWLVSIWRQKAFSIRPGVNLVRNIGFDESATHTKSMKDELISMQVYDLDILKLKEPKNGNVIRKEDEQYWAQISIKSVVKMIISR